MSRIAATGLIDAEFDEIKTDNIIIGENNVIIDETGLQVYHNYNVLLPTVFSGYWNVHDELENAAISNTAQDLELINLQSSVTTLSWNITSLGSTVGIITATTIPGIITNVSYLQATKQDKIISVNPLNLNTTTNNLSLNYDNLKLDVSNNNLTIKQPFIDSYLKITDASTNFVLKTYFDTSYNGFKTYVDTSLNTIKTDLTTNYLKITDAATTYYTKTYYDTSYNGFKSYVDTSLNSIKTDLTTNNLKITDANSTYYNKTYRYII